jgi:hypothetical protein
LWEDVGVGDQEIMEAIGVIEAIRVTEEIELIETLCM